jgi:pimeloyl-ACP methyl ester carboxylesterase
MKCFRLILILVFLVCCAGCTGVANQDEKPEYLLADDGNLSFHLPAAPVTSEPVRTNGTIRVEELTFLTVSGNVTMILVAPEHPKAGFVWAPGAGVPASGHIEHLLAYAEKGYAVLVDDIRGNGGKTPGYPLNLDTDYQKLVKGEWPQVYLIIADLIQAEKYLHERYGNIPVYIVGESNGGRYAAVAVATDPNLTGYAGISTSGFGRQGDQYSGKAKSFMLSIDPDAVAARISDRPAYIFHAPKDPIIPFGTGKELATAIGGKTEFIPFNGTHGVTGEVDRILIDRIHALS